MKERNPRGTPSDALITGALARIEEDTLGLELNAKQAGLTVEEYEKLHGRTLREKKEISVDVGTNEETLFELWVMERLSTDLLNNDEVVEIVREIFKHEDFQNVWNYKIYFQEGLNAKDLARESFNKIKDLERLSGFKLTKFRKPMAENIFVEMDEIEKLLSFLQEEMLENPSKEGLDKSKEDYGVSISLYLRLRIVIEKLEEMLRILKDYKLY